MSEKTFLRVLGPEPVIRAASQSAGSLWVIQLLSRFEADPSTLGGRRLVDVDFALLDRARAPGSYSRSSPWCRGCGPRRRRCW